MNKPLIFGIGVGVLLIGGVALAASGSSPKPAGALAPGGKPKVALDAIQSADAKRIRDTSISLATSDAAISAGLYRTAQFVDGLVPLPADVRALVLGGLRSVDRVTLLGVAAQLQPKGYPTLAVDTAALAEFVGWLQKGAPGAPVPFATLPASMPTTVPQVTPTVPQVTPVGIPSAVAASTQIDPADAQDVANVIATADPAKIRAAAAKYRAAGKIAIAEALEKAAQAIEATQSLPTVKPPTVPQVTPTVPQVTPTIPQVTTPANKILASKTALAVTVAGPMAKGTSKEPRAIVQAFQQAEKLTRQDGSYGSETALALAERYGIVPPKPYYWGAKKGDYNTLVADKAQYKRRIAACAVGDPQRIDEWNLAAKV